MHCIQLGIIYNHAVDSSSSDNDYWIALYMQSEQIIATSYSAFVSFFWWRCK